MADQDPDQENNLNAPRLVASLRELHKESVLVPSEVDAIVLDRIRPQLAAIRRRHARRRNTTRLLALAAALAIMGWIVNLALNPMRGVRATATEDLNHDGKVDILDAFQLARDIKSGNTIPARLDLNGDGRVDAADVALIARKAVSLEQGAVE
ncbi:MAG TPA: dockerin type I repeat-containing protein [Verrucomicrobiae bacterium]|nr:dockerin type I repeat-containing protein [Verrucomicrobiae bacterium]